MNDATARRLGWGFVFAQSILLVTLIVLPSGDRWPTPDGVHLAGTIIVALGLLLVIIASLRLGSSLTPTPVPSDRGSLTTTGLYHFVRHPIYTGVLMIVVGLVLPSGSAATLIVGLVTIGFFNAKAMWEEQRLAERYPEYPEYVQTTPRFLPNPWHHRA